MEKEEFSAHIMGKTLSSNSKKAYTLSKENFLGEMKNGKVIYSLSEGMYLAKHKGMKIYFGKNPMKENEIFTRFLKMEKNFPSKYHVYEDLRRKGFILKSGANYGADFSVYDKGKKPGKAHSSWLLSIENTSKGMKMEGFILKNRVANSTKKKVLLAIVNPEGGILYYEVGWKKF